MFQSLGYDENIGYTASGNSSVSVNGIGQNLEVIPDVYLRSTILTSQPSLAELFLLLSTVLYMHYLRDAQSNHR